MVLGFKENMMKFRGWRDAFCVIYAIGTIS
jgi:hypothetical protein